MVVVFELPGLRLLDADEQFWDYAPLEWLGRPASETMCEVRWRPVLWAMREALADGEPIALILPRCRLTVVPLSEEGRVWAVSCLFVPDAQAPLRDPALPRRLPATA